MAGGMLGVEVHMPEEYPPQYPNQPYPGQPSPYQQFAAPAPQPAPYYGGQGGYQNSFFYEQSRQQEGGKHATNGVVLGCIGTFCALFLGWIPFLGILGVAAGAGCGIPAILQGKKAELFNVSGRAGIILGWVAVGFSAFWTAIYLFFMFIGMASDSSYPY